MKKTHLELSMRFKIWVSCLLVLLVPFFFMATFGYYWLKRNIDQESLGRHTAYLKDAVKMVDENFEQLDSVLGQLAQTAWMTKLVNMQGNEIDRNRISAYSMMEYQQFIYACQQSIPGSSFLGVYFPRKNFIISSRMNGTLDFLLHDALSPQGLTKGMIMGKVLNMKEKETICLVEDAMYQYGKKGSGILVLKTILKLPDLPSPGAVLISYISHERLLRAVDISLGSGEFLSLGIKDNSGYILYAGLGEGDSAFSVQMASPVTGWIYEMTVSKSILLKEIVLMRNFLCLIAAGILFLCLAISTVFTIRIYKPIRETMELLAVNTVYGGNELKQIKSDIAVLIQQRDELREKVREHAPVLLSYYYSQLLLGPKEEHGPAADALGKLLAADYFFYRVCILIQKTPSGVALATRPALLVQSALDKPDTVHVFAINQNSRTLLILHYNNEEEFISWQVNALNQFPRVFIASGCAVRSMKEIGDSFADANRVSDFRLIQSVRRGAETPNDVQGCYFPFEAEADLMIALRTKNLARAEKLIKRILDKNTVSEDSRNGIYHGLELILRTVSADVPSLPAGGREEWIYACIRDICSRQQGTSSKRTVDPKLLLELVDSSIQNPSISLQYIADRFDVSESLVSKVFKESEGVGFNKYINKKRIELAKNFLSEGYEVAAAAKMAGYSNDTTFRRCFESAVGLSPTEFKRQAKHTS
jgi:AraC-like DNA-binding protein